MDKYKEYTAHTQNERIMLDILCALDKLVAAKEPTQVNIKVEDKPKRSRKGGEK